MYRAWRGFDTHTERERERPTDPGVVYESYKNETIAYSVCLSSVCSVEYRYQKIVDDGVHDHLCVRFHREESWGRSTHTGWRGPYKQSQYSM